MPTGEKLDLAHGGDGGEGLAAKAHGADGLQARLVTELGGGVAHEGDARVLGGHALAVVLDSYIGRAAVADLDGNAVGACVKGVLHELLDDGGGALHHLAGGDHIRHVRGEDVDFGHSITFLTASLSEGGGTARVRPRRDEGSCQSSCR